MKVIYKGPSDYYITGSKTFERDGDLQELDQNQLKQAQAKGHSFQTVKEPKEESENARSNSS